MAALAQAQIAANDYQKICLLEEVVFSLKAVLAETKEMNRKSDIILEENKEINRKIEVIVRAVYIQKPYPANTFSCKNLIPQIFFHLKNFIPQTVFH